MPHAALTDNVTDHATLSRKTSPVFKIVPTTQDYDWGKIGLSSSVAKFAEASAIPGFIIDHESPYAELWMGTHTKSPSYTLSSEMPLSEYLAAHPELMGTAVIQKFRAEGADKGNLPFLFKILSIEKALSIQTHPDKKTAEDLRLNQPAIYKDPNHKPEMALALTPFQALCGFRPLNEIASYLSSTPELTALIPRGIVDTFLSISLSTFTTTTTSSSSDPIDSNGPEAKAALKNLFGALMTAPEEDIKTQLQNLLIRYHKGVGPDDDAEIVDLVKRLASQFPGDVGVFCAFVLNYVKLQPGQAIFLGAGEPHAYVHGECIECMANSDNVIRAGLTPKLRDIPNLVSGLTYNAAPSSKHVVDPKPFGPSSVLYDPPIPEFSVVQVALEERGKKEAHRPVDGPSLLVVTEGGGVIYWGADSDGGEEKLQVGLGDVVFLGADNDVTFEAGKDGRLVLYRAFVEA